MSDWCNHINDVIYYCKLYLAHASKVNADDFYEHIKFFSSHTMSVAPESGWKLQAVTLQGGLIGIQLGMSPCWNFTNSSDTE